MSIFGPIIDSDLPLLRLAPAALNTLTADEQWEFHDQLAHHCFRVVWKEFARTGAPVRDLLSIAIGNAYAIYAKACDRRLNEEMLARAREDARRLHEIGTCLGFLLDEECRTIMQGTLTPYPTAHSIFTNDDLGPHAKRGQPISMLLAWALLNKLRKMWENYRRNVATDPLVRETVRIVQHTTGRDPHLMSCPRLDLYLREVGAELNPKERALALQL